MGLGFGQMGRRVVASVVMVLCMAQSALGISLVRDPDIEHALTQIATPILKSAGLSPSRVKILVINDRALNAFVVDRDHIFIHAGLLMRLKTVDQLQGVLAHEAAHIANGHLERRKINAGNARSLAGLGLLLAAAAGAASNNAEVGAAVAIGTAGASQRAFLAHTRAEEASADQSALRWMAQAGADPKAMIEVFELFRGQEVLNAARQDPYVRAHPLTRDRLSAAKGFATAHKVKPGQQNQAQYWFLRAQGKLEAFTRNPAQVLRKVGRKDQGEIALLRRAIAYHQQGQKDKSIAQMRALLAKRPNDPYYHELHGQILLENRQFQAASNAYGRAVKLRANHGLLLASYGRALLASKDKRALGVLKSAYANDPQSPRLLRDLAVAYAQNKNPGQASLVTAERYALLGRFKDAALHAKRAEGLLPNGSSAERRAQDILFSAKKLGITP